MDQSRKKSTASKISKTLSSSGKNLSGSLKSLSGSMKSLASKKKSFTGSVKKSESSVRRQSGGSVQLPDSTKAAKRTSSEFTATKKKAPPAPEPVASTSSSKSTLPVESKQLPGNEGEKKSEKQKLGVKDKIKRGSAKVVNKMGRFKDGIVGKTTGNVKTKKGFNSNVEENPYMKPVEIPEPDLFSLSGPSKTEEKKNQSEGSSPKPSCCKRFFCCCF